MLLPVPCRGRLEFCVYGTKAYAVKKMLNRSARQDFPGSKRRMDSGRPDSYFQAISL
jgi:hypothetical protein